jgi:hypothetical protein
MLLRSTLSVWVILAGLAPSAGRADRPSECPEQPPAGTSILILEDRTDSPIYVYLDDVFVARCDNLQKQKVLLDRCGEVTIMGRFRCDTWGPRVIKLQPGKTTSCAFTEVGRTQSNPARNQTNSVTRNAAR